MGSIQTYAQQQTEPMVGCGDLSIHLHGDRNDWLQMVTDRYQAFSLPAQPTGDWFLDYRVVGESRLTSLHLYQARQAPLSFKKSSKNQLAFEGLGFSGHIDWLARTVSLKGPLATYPIDLILPILWYGSHDDGLIIHAAALADDQWGYLMAGPSGAGKTTLTKLFPELALADEFAAVWQLKQPMMTGLPFWRGKNGARPLRGIYLLRHGQTHSCQRLNAKAALKGLRAQVSWPTYDESRLAKAFYDLLHIVEQATIYQLAFRPDRTVWQTVEGCDAP